VSASSQKAWGILPLDAQRSINRLKQWRGLATRYEKRAVNYLAMVVIAAIVTWLQW
jgi:transposase